MRESILSDNFGSARLFYFYKNYVIFDFIEGIKIYKENRLDNFFFRESLRRFLITVRCLNTLRGKFSIMGQCLSVYFTFLNGNFWLDIFIIF